MMKTGNTNTSNKDSSTLAVIDGLGLANNNNNDNQTNQPFELPAIDPAEIQANRKIPPSKHPHVSDSQPCKGSYYTNPTDEEFAQINAELKGTGYRLIK